MCGKKKCVHSLALCTFFCVAAHFLQKVMTSSTKKNVRNEKKCAVFPVNLVEKLGKAKKMCEKREMCTFLER